MRHTPAARHLVHLDAPTFGSATAEQGTHEHATDEHPFGAD